MTAAMEYLSRMTDKFFESQMRRAACRITTASTRLRVVRHNTQR
jgi:hypothetical protein